LWDTGERTGAMLQLQWHYLDWRTGNMVVPAEVRKNAKPIYYRLKRPTLDALKAIRRPQRELIFDMQSSVGSFHDCHNKLIRSAGLTYVTGKTGPQKMRRTFASFIEAAGGNATKALKHTDRRVTEDSYLDPRICETTQENEKLFSLSSGKGGAL
jgi:integrase